MPSRTTRLPSGLIVNVRGLRTKEADTLANPDNHRSGVAFDKMLADCLVGVEDAGPYDLKDSRVPWADALVCDRFVAMLQIRAATYGPEYSFTLQCDNPMCRKVFDWSIDIDRDLPIKEVPHDSVLAFKAGNKLTTRVVLSGREREVTFKLTTGKDEGKTRGRKEHVLTDSLAIRVLAIEGVEGNDRVRFIENMELSETDALIEALDAADGGVDVRLDVQCEHCGNTQEAQLPFGKAFFRPRKNPLAAASATSSRSLTQRR